MDQTFFVFIILFAIIIIYLFKQKNDHQEMKEQLNQYVAEEHFQNQVNNAEYKDDILKKLINYISFVCEERYSY